MRNRARPDVESTESTTAEPRHPEAPSFVRLHLAPASESDDPAAAEARYAAEQQRALELCQSIAAGDRRAFAELVETYQHRVYGFCARMLGGDRAEAEDLAQDVFLSVYRNAGAFREEASFTTWLFRIARNKTLNRIKYLERRGRGARSSWDELADSRTATALVSEARDPHALVEGQQTAALVQSAIAELPEQQRAVLVLRDIEGLSYEEIMEVTGLALGTVKSRIHRARNLLAQRLQRVFR